MKFTDKLQYLRYLVDKRGMKPVYLILGLTYDCNSFCRTCFNWEQFRKNKEHELSLRGAAEDVLVARRSALHRHERRRAVPAPRSARGLRDAVDEEPRQADHDPDRRDHERSDRAAGGGDAAALPDTQIVVNLSIDHVGEKHDWIRGVPGNYEKAKKTYAHLIPLREKYANLTVNVHTCLCTYNADDLDELFVAVRRDFPAISFHSFEMLRGDQPDKNIQPITTDSYRELLPKLEAYWNTYSHYDSFLKFVKIYTRRLELEILEQETQVKPCHAGRISGVLDARGEVRMCELRDAVGNVRDTGYDFGKLWFSPRPTRSGSRSRRRSATARTPASCRRRWSSTCAPGARTLRRRS